MLLQDAGDDENVEEAMLFTENMISG